VQGSVSALCWCRAMTFLPAAEERRRGSGRCPRLLTIFLSTAGYGGILNVVNGTGGSSTIANPDVPVTVLSYP
jgi:hypothetical protein